MTRGIRLSLITAAVTLILFESAGLVRFLTMCVRHLAWERVESRRSPVIRDTGYLVARPGDAIYACRSEHCFLGLTCHQDLECDCAPATLTAARVGQLVSGSCVLDEASPSPEDERGACRRARCDAHVDP